MMMMKEKPYVVIFDWDDTLLNSGPALSQSKIQAIADILEHTDQYPFTQGWQCPSLATLQQHAGQRLKEKVIYAVMPRLQADNPDHQTWIDDTFERFKDHYKHLHKSLFPGIEAMLKTLQTSCDLCIATNKSRNIFMQELKMTGLTETFTHIKCGDDSELKGQFKPHPNMLNLIQAHYPIDTHFIMVGDREFDISAAQASNRAALTKTIGICNTLSLPQADLQLPSAALITLEGIQTLIKQNTHSKP